MTSRDTFEFRMVELDSRRRLSLAKIARPEHNRFLVTVEADGTIILEPAKVLRINRVEP
jgi:hypothetical protein